MELILFVYLLVNTPGQTKVNPDAPSDVEVVRFSWSYQKSVMPEGRWTENATPSERRREFRREVENTNALENRIRGLRDLEDSARREAIESKPVDLYRYSIELKNRGSKVIKWIFVDYQVTPPSDPDNPSHRQFACAVKAKPDESKKLEAYSLLPPTRLISATDPQARPTEKLIINRVEYHDGTIWQRTGWPAPESLPRSTGRGPCRAI